MIIHVCETKQKIQDMSRVNVVAFSTLVNYILQNFAHDLIKLLEQMGKIIRSTLIIIVEPLSTI